jgi:hypothetical protein
MGSSITAFDVDPDRKRRVEAIIRWSNMRRGGHWIKADWVDAVVGLRIDTKDLFREMDRAWRFPNQIYAPSLLLIRLQDRECAIFKGDTRTYRPRHGLVKAGQFDPSAFVAARA